MMPNESSGSLPERAKRFYERVSREREAALAGLPDLYAPDVRFQNPVVDERGLRLFEKQWQRALKLYPVFEFEDISIAGDDSRFTMSYTMNLRLAIGPTFRPSMMTESHGSEGKVSRTRDYFDVVGALAGPFPGVSWVYRKVFGILIP